MCPSSRRSGAWGVLEVRALLQDGLEPHHTGAPHLLHAPLLVLDPPVPRHDLHGLVTREVAMETVYETRSWTRRGWTSREPARFARRRARPRWSRSSPCPRPCPRAAPRDAGAARARRRRRPGAPRFSFRAHHPRRTGTWKARPGRRRGSARRRRASSRARARLCTRGESRADARTPSGGGTEGRQVRAFVFRARRRARSRAGFARASLNCEGGRGRTSGNTSTVPWR